MFDQLKHYYEQYKQYTWLAVIGMLLLVGIFLFIHPNEEPAPIEAKAADKPAHEYQKGTNSTFEKGKETSEPIKTNGGKVKNIVVDVKGAVEHPNIYEMKDNQRVKDVLDKAKITSKADLTLINLSEKLTDQKMIVVPEKGQTVSNTTNTNAAASSKQSGSPQAKVNLNSAKESELTTVNGLGPSKAKAIIEYRESKGSFKSVDQLKNVKGIGEKSFEKLKDYFTV